MTDGTRYDKCPECGHTWHGLTCQWETKNMETRQMEACGCPSRFGVDDEDSE